MKTPAVKELSISICKGCFRPYERVRKTCPHCYPKQQNEKVNSVKNRIQQIENDILTLENGDERLFTNGNGNLPRYRALQAELAVLSGKYKRVKIKCVETGDIYDSSVAAARAVGCSKSAMANHLMGRFPHVRGLHFERTAVLSPKVGDKR